MPYLTVKFKGRQLIFGTWYEKRYGEVTSRSETKAQMTRKSGTMCVSWGRSLLLSQCNFSLLNGSALRMSRGTATSTKYYPPFFHVSVHLSYSWRSNAVRMSSACYNPVFLQIRLLYAAMLIRKQCLSQLQIMFPRVATAIWEQCWLLKNCSRSVSKVRGLGECYKFRKPVFFCGDSEENDYGTSGSIHPAVMISRNGYC